VLLTVALAQQKKAATPRPQTKPQTPTVNCSDVQTSKACGSFKQLLDAHDKDVIELLSLPTSYVCFRPNEDSFLILEHKDPLSPYEWRSLDDGVGEIQQSTTNLIEYRDGVETSAKYVRRYWYRYSTTAKPLFRPEKTDDIYEGLKLNIDDSEISIDFPFKNQNGGTTEYSLVIRRSTGRFVETFSAEGTPNTTHSGTCLIYR
jgi:hypothetical protein